VVRDAREPSGEGRAFFPRVEGIARAVKIAAAGSLVMPPVLPFSLRERRYPSAN